MAQAAEVVGDARQSSPRRAEMIRVAARLFSQRGYHGTSMQHLGEALGLLRGSLYAHIGSKEELLFEVVDGGAERFLERAHTAADQDSPARERLTALLVAHVQTVAEHIDAATVFLNEWRYLSEDRRSIIQNKRDAYEQIVREVIADGVTAGEFRDDLDVGITTRLVLSAANWTYTWYRPGGSLSAEEVGRAFADQLVRGLEPSQAEHEKGVAPSLEEAG